MGRPEQVRCENCCYWVNRDHPEQPPSKDGLCSRHPPEPSTALHIKYVDGNRQHYGVAPWTGPDWYCGEFRAEWPVEEWLDWDIPEHRSIIEKMLTVVRKAEKST